jgi:YidC/Oxa1 family membrane protein insertase
MPGDKQQKMIGGYMAVVMLFFGWTAPAGVLLYWDVSSIWGVAQQQLMMASLKRSHEDEIVVEEPKKSSKKKAKKQ